MDADDSSLNNPDTFWRKKVLCCWLSSRVYVVASVGPAGD